MAMRPRNTDDEAPWRNLEEFRKFHREEEFAKTKIDLGYLLLEGYTIGFLIYRTIEALNYSLFFYAHFYAYYESRTRKNLGLLNDKSNGVSSEV